MGFLYDGMRPMYESQGDLSTEREIISTVAEKWKVSPLKLPIAYSFDFSMYRGDALKAVVEVKRRKHRFGHFPDVILSLAKFNTALSFINMGIPAIFVVEFDDGIRFHRFDPDFPYNFSMGGRSDRGDWQDVEPVVLIPTETFKTL